jgi:hypothetical protein
MSQYFGPVYGLKFFLPNKRILNFGREDDDLITVSYGMLELIDYFSPSGFSIVRFLSIADSSANSSLISKEKNTTKSPAENLKQKCQYCANIFLFGGF